MANVDDIWDDWKAAVNMTAREIEEWLETEESREVGQKDAGGESVGHRSGRRIVEILGTRKADLTDSQVEWMPRASVARTMGSWRTSTTSGMTGRPRST